MRCGVLTRLMTVEIGVSDESVEVAGEEGWLYAAISQGVQICIQAQSSTSHSIAQA